MEGKNHMADVKLEGSEELLLSYKFGVSAKDNQFRNRTVFITDKRFVIHKISIWTWLLLGYFALFAKGNYEYEVKIKDIIRVEKTKYLFNKSVLDVILKDGSVYRFNVMKEFNAIIDILQYGLNKINKELIWDEKTQIGEIK